MGKPLPTFCTRPVTAERPGSRPNLPPDVGLPGTPGLISVHPLDPTLLFFGSTNLFRSQDGGSTWQNVMTAASGLSLHVDQHALVFTADGKTIYEGNDGGIWTAANPYGSQIGWTDLNTGLGTAEIYSVAIDPQNTSRAVAGTQDNSTLWFTGSPGWTQAGVCGDGFATAVDPSSLSTVYAACGETLFKSINGGVPGSWVQIGAGLPGFALTLDDSTPNVLYAGNPGGDSALYQSLDGGGTWRQVFAGSGSQFIDQVAVSPSNSNIVYLLIGDYQTYPYAFQLWATNDALSGSIPTWQNLPVSNLLPVANAASLAVDPANPEAVAVFTEQAARTICGSGCGVENSILTSADGGATGQTIPAGGGLNATALYWSNILFNDCVLCSNKLQILIDPDILNTWYLAAGLAVYRSSDAGRTWYPLAAGVP
jgi:photosystem II stability/assembly factor-like uncharacterized protein